MRFSVIQRSELTNAAVKEIVTLTAPAVYVPPYGKTVFEVSGQGQPGNTSVPGNVTGSNPPGGTPIYNPGSGGNPAGSNPPSYFHNVVYSAYNVNNVPSSPVPSPYSDGNSSTNYTANSSNTTTYVYDQPGNGPSPYTNYGPSGSTFTATFAYSGAVPGNPTYNPFSPGNPVYNPTTPGNAYSNPGLYGWTYVQNVYTNYGTPTPGTPIANSTANTYYSVNYPSPNVQLVYFSQNAPSYSTGGVPSPSVNYAPGGGGGNIEYATNYSHTGYSPGGTSYNPDIPGNQAYNGGPGTPNYNPSTPGNPGSPTTVFGVVFPGGAADTLAPTVGATTVAIPFSYTGTALIVPTGATINIRNR